MNTRLTGVIDQRSATGLVGAEGLSRATGLGSRAGNRLHCAARLNVLILEEMVVMSR